MNILSNFGIITVLPDNYPICGNREGVETVNVLIDFLVSVMASVVGYYVCKWFDRRDKGR